MNTCMFDQALLDAWLDQELNEADRARVQEHLDTCPSCRAYVDDFLAIRAAFPSVEDVEVPDGFAEGVMAAIRADAAPQKKRRSPWVRVAVSLAACCALVIMVQESSVVRPPSLTELTAPAEASADYDLPAEGQMEDTEKARPAQTYLLDSTEADADTPVSRAFQQAEADFPVFAAITLSAQQAGEALTDYPSTVLGGGVLFYQLLPEEYDGAIASLQSAGAHWDTLLEEPAQRELSDACALIFVTTE